MKKLFKILLILLLCLLLVVAGYASYVVLAFHRIEDNVILTVNTAEGTTAAPIGQELKILSYNVGFGAYSDDYSFFMDGGTESRCRSKEIGIENIRASLSLAKKEEADIYLFQEVDINGTRSYHVDQFALLSEGFPRGFASSFAMNYDSPYLFWPLTAPHGKNQAGITLFSRFTVESALRRQLPIEEGLMKLLDLDRAYSKNRIPTENGKELIVYNLHLSAYTSDGTIATEQLKMLLSDMKEEYERGNYCLAGGDFNKDLPGDSGDTENTWAQPIPPALIPTGITLIPPEASPLKSCRNADAPYDPAVSFTVTVDGFLISDNIACVESKVVNGGFRHSDHNPVYMNFVLR